MEAHLSIHYGVIRLISRRNTRTEYVFFSIVFRIRSGIRSVFVSRCHRLTSRFFPIEFVFFLVHVSTLIRVTRR